MKQIPCSGCGGSGIQNTLEVNVDENGNISGHVTVIRTCGSCGGMGKVWSD